MMKQKGFVTLAITSVLLTIVLGYSLSSYRGVLYQIKVANNEVAARQAHWQAEGGLECGFAHIVHDSATAIPTNLKSVCSDLGLSSLSASPANADTLVASDGNTSVSKTINFGSAGLAGAIRSTSDLVINGATNISPPDPGFKNSNGAYECISAVVSNYLIATGVNSFGLAIPPSQNFPVGGKCAADHQSQTVGNSGIWQKDGNGHTPQKVKDDFQRDEKLNPFKNTFGYEKWEWEQVRGHPDYNFEHYEMKGNDVDCVSQFEGDIKLGKPNAIWITGSCQLDSTAFDKIKKIQKTAGTYLFLLVHNGVLALDGAGRFDGVIFHFNHGYIPDVNQWDKFNKDVTSVVKGAIFDKLLSEIYPSGRDAIYATYLQNGSFYITGGMIFDTPNHIALFNNAINLQYNSDIETSFTFEGKPRWKKGSWNDL